MVKTNNLDALVAAMNKKENRDTLTVESKGIEIEVRELTYKQLKQMGKDTEFQMDSKNKFILDEDGNKIPVEDEEALAKTLASMVTKVTFTEDGIVVEGDPLVHIDALITIVDSLGLKGVRELSEGLAELNGTGKTEEK